MTVLEALQFEREWETQSGSKTAAIRTRFGISTTRYYQLLYGWLNDPATERLDPLLVRRLIRLMEHRTRQRATRTFGGRAYLATI